MRATLVRSNLGPPPVRLLLVSSLCLGFAIASLQARPIPQNLAGGLGTLVESNAATKANPNSARFNGYATEQAANYAALAIQDPDTGRFLVDIHPVNKRVNAEQLVPLLQQRLASFTLTALDKTYRGVGVVEGWISLDDVPALGNMHEVRSVSLGLKPEMNKHVPPGGGIQVGTKLTVLGTTADQGVYAHRVDQINKFYNPSAKQDVEGSGMSIGLISDSIGDVSTDVTNFDLPGASGNPLNTQPVVVLQDIPGTDEGRGMCQIAYKMAPKARLGFATANGGEVGFANNIRALAGLPGFTYPPNIQQGFKADVICDDVGYSDEPFFQDGLIGDAVDDVFAAGVSYFSSAGNDIGTYDYDAEFVFVPNDSHATDGTNIKLTGVPTNLYQGGFHNFNTNGKDIAQTVNVLSTPPATNFQWTDPYNQVLDFDPTPIFTAHATYTNQEIDFTTPSLTAGQNYVITVTADAGSSFDAIVTIKDPTGKVVVDHQDTGTDETVDFFPPVAGAYTIAVTNFGGTMGPFTVNIYNGHNPQISTDYNLLVFDLEGNYMSGSSLTTNNFATNAPIEYGITKPKAGETQVQYVISRSNTPTQSGLAHHLRWIIRGNGLGGIGPAEYLSLFTANTHGHATANGCNGVAAYNVFRPSIPEFYSSPGPAAIFFDKMGNPLHPQEIRMQPGVAAADNANTSFFGGDSTSDLDVKPNFSGTSAASPHAAAIAALVLEANGGPGSVTPAQMMTILHETTFDHDLDPNLARGAARTSDGSQIVFQAQCDYGLNPSSGAGNADSLILSYRGTGALKSIVFNPAGTAATAGNTTGGNNGLDLVNNQYFNNIYPGIVFVPAAKPFTVGTSDVPPSDITAAFSNQAPAPSFTGQWWTMTINFANNTFTNGKQVHFTVGHGPQHNSQVSNGTGNTGGATAPSFTQADLFGGELLIPDGAVTKDGMAFSGTTSTGATFSGVISNQIGSGYSRLDGYGFINAEAAVKDRPH